MCKEQFTVRAIRFQFRRSGLIHLADVKDFHPHSSGWSFTSLPYITHCGLNIPMGRGGWGYGPQKECPRCFPKNQSKGVA